VDRPIFIGMAGESARAWVRPPRQPVRSAHDGGGGSRARISAMAVRIWLTRAASRRAWGLLVATRHTATLRGAPGQSRQIPRSKRAYGGVQRGRWWRRRSGSSTGGGGAGPIDGPPTTTTPNDGRSCLADSTIRGPPGEDIPVGLPYEPIDH